jgi:hypothetical protein
VSDYAWSELCDRALSEIVAGTPTPRWAGDGWSTRSRSEPPLIELGDLVFGLVVIPHVVPDGSRVGPVASGTAPGGFLFDVRGRTHRGGACCDRA